MYKRNGVCCIMNTIVGIDPGKHKIAYAYGKDRIVNCGLIRFETLFELREKFSWIGGFQIVVELPRYYPGTNIRANDLIDLSLSCGFMLSFEGAIPVFPKEWKGSVPKKIHHPRILKKLSKEEMKLLPKKGRKSEKNPTGYQGDIVDAIGIWQWGKVNL